MEITAPPRSGIYRITNTANGRVYIGQASNVRARLKTHRSRLVAGRHYNLELQLDWHQHGPDAFESGVVIECEAAERAALEREHIAGALYRYNLNVGAAGRPTIGAKALARADVTLDDETREGLKSLGDGNLSAGIRAAWQMLKRIMPSQRRGK